MIWLFCIIFSLYFSIMLSLLVGFYKIKTFQLKNSAEKTSFSIIVPFRNEAENLPKLINSLQQIKYPKHLYEIIFVDDESEDNSVEIITENLKENSDEFEIHFKIINNIRYSKSPKKDAITNAVKIANFDWIVTTDADCEVPSTWLAYFDSFIQIKDPKMICGPVIYNASRSFLEKFQKLDGLSLQAATIGSFGIQKPILCNGANLAYRKDVFIELSGFSGNSHLASGDDIFMLEKVNERFPNKVLFINNFAATVITQPQKSWKAIIDQRVRWASKTSQTKNLFSKFVGLVVLFTSILILLTLLYIIFFPKFIISFSVYLFLKILVDFAVIKKTAKVLQQKIEFLTFLQSVVMYPFIVTLVAVKSLSGSYNWKGRNFSNKS